MKKKQDEISIKDLINIFLPKAWIIVIVAVAFAAVLGGYSVFLEKDTFTSKSTFVMVKTPTQYGSESGNNAITTGLNGAEIEAMQAMIAMSEQIMETNSFLSIIKNELVARDASFSSVTLAELKQMLSIKVVGEATVFNVSVTSGNSRLSYEVADVVHDMLPEKIEEVFSSYSIKIKDIDPPRVSTRPNNKNTLRNAIIGFAGGALVSMLVIFVVSKLDVVVRSKEKLEDNFDIPVIGVIPHLDDEA